MTTLRLRRGGLEWKEIDDELVAIDVPSSTYLSTNGSGGMLWRALAAGATADDLVAALCDEYGIDAERSSRDVDAFLSELNARGLLEAS